MAKTLYTAEAQVAGGRDKGHGKTTDGALEVDLRVPAEMGGDGGGTNPEQLFAVGFASCFESALGVMSRRQRVESGDATIDPRSTCIRPKRAALSSLWNSTSHCPRSRMPPPRWSW